MSKRHKYEYVFKHLCVPMSIILILIVHQGRGVAKGG